MIDKSKISQVWNVEKCHRKSNIELRVSQTDHREHKGEIY